MEAEVTQTRSSRVFFNILLLCAVALFSLAALAQEITGTADDGSLYAIVRPSNWNGQLVLYAHGIIDPKAPVALPNDAAFTGFRDGLLQQGFAVGYSSWAKNGFAVKEGVRATDDLRDRFINAFGKPQHTFLVGASLGGLVVLDLAERFPAKYDGALPMCGVLGGSPLEVKYVGNGRVLFDYFFPGVLPGSLLHTPDIDYSPGALTPNYGNAVMFALMDGLDPTKNAKLPTLQLANAVGLEYATPNEVFYGLMQLVGFDVRYVNELLSRTNGKSPYDNLKTTYSGSADDSALNKNVERIASDRPAMEYLDHYFEPTGSLRIPVVALHTTRDPVVPHWHEQVYQQLAAQQQSSQWLVQQSVNRFGHCEFQAPEVLHAFQSLAVWVNYGVKPAGGDITVH
jgi:pimeloyl-ACP methyl ester carboxylesterase